MDWPSVVAVSMSTAVALALRPWRGLPHAGPPLPLAQPLPPGLLLEDLLLARGLTGWGDAMLTGMIVAIFVAFRPQWLATYADRLYLPTRNGGPP